MTREERDITAAGLLRLLLSRTDSDIAALGEADGETRKLKWLLVEGGASARTERIRQKLSDGLTGSALRSGRMIKLDSGLTDREFFKLGEAIVLTEGLRAAAALPLHPSKHHALVAFIGRRRDESYSAAAMTQADEVGRLLTACWRSDVQ
ncbi:GAF domain-containing protein [Paenibacillus sp. 1011MAR3C5]|uniref:GAF domain-containing protein n=1 Tax=Paenibacillus sp. 1011MAR3C5 TaxID=1675787 RepID=UPI000E6B525E|nr:GAF domain-containing protein [Paenibacillus sp. 1011MAR3C5]RJE88929.1 GAF domain-containing protein [Paenibacillus sp. 1011MAR3C5]